MNNLPPAHRLLLPLTRAVAILDAGRPKGSHHLKVGLSLILADVLGWTSAFLLGLIALRLHSGFEDAAFIPWWHNTRA